MKYAATIGFFDGVHRGHQNVIRRLCDLAKERGLRTRVITFENHPLSIVRPGSEPELLCSIEERKKKLLKAGADEVITLRFTREMMQRPAREFMEHYLRDELQIKLLMLGYDNRFGKRQEGEGFPQYVEYGSELGIEVIEGPRPEEAGLFEGRAISSSLVRELLTNGRKTEAEKLMNI